MDWDEIIDARDIMEKMHEIEKGLKNNYLSKDELREIKFRLENVRSIFKRGHYGTRSMDATIELDYLCDLVEKMLKE